MVSEPDLVGQFESLGDNCEFGFVQRHHGIEPGGLLRWAASTLDGLLVALDRRFAGIFDFADLVPHTVNMVRDEKYAIAFHTEMRSQPVDGDLRFELTGDELRKIHEEEHAKIAYLGAKLIETLRAGTRILVYKRNAGLSLHEIARLKDAIDAYGPNRLLCVVPESADLPAGAVADVYAGTKLAAIEQLAPYHHVEMALYESWTAVCRTALDAPWPCRGTARRGGLKAAIAPRWLRDRAIRAP
jgi:hypothetical protein